MEWVWERGRRTEAWSVARRDEMHGVTEKRRNSNRGLEERFVMVRDVWLSLRSVEEEEELMYLN